MLSFTYQFNYGTLNIFKVQGTALLANQPLEFNNYILTDKNSDEINYTPADEILRLTISAKTYQLIAKYHNKI